MTLRFVRNLLANATTDASPVCRKCGGRGRLPDHAMIGRIMRGHRLERGVSLREIARRLRFSYMYISHLEVGRRAWNEKLLLRYHAAVNK